MTKPHQEQLIQDLYSESKKAISQPKDVTNNALRYAKQQSNPLAFLMRWQTVTAAFLIGFMWLQLDSNNNPTYSITAGVNANNQTIYYHDVTYGEAKFFSHQKQINQPKKDPEYTAYLDSLAKLDNASLIAGVVTQTAGNVEVEICTLGLVQLSPLVLASIGSPTIVEQLQVGQAIALRTNKNGMIVSIESSQTADEQYCAD